IAMKSDSSYLVEIDFEQEFDDDTLITVVGNAYLLKTAFVNLLENNCKFSDNHTSQVQISANDKEAVIRFSDTGIGIADDDLPFIFDPFYRGKNKSFAKGNGIGMALVKRIVELHNGSIEVVSHPNEGTLFILRIPHIF
ncbi:MAG: sensor histidine kinase, partial [Tannerellaceae bacterium]